MKDLYGEIIEIAHLLGGLSRTAAPTNDAVREPEEEDAPEEGSPDDEDQGEEEEDLESDDLEDLGFDDTDTNFDKLRSPYIEGEGDDEELSEESEDFDYQPDDLETQFETQRDQLDAQLEARRVDNIIRIAVDSLVRGLRDGMNQGRDQLTYRVAVQNIPWKKLGVETLARFDRYKDPVTKFVQEMDPRIQQVDWEVTFHDQDLYMNFVVDFSPE